MSADFLDSNIFVYSFDRANERKRSLARHLIADVTESGTGVISHQVIQEVLNVLTSKAPYRMPPEQTRRFFHEVMRPLRIRLASVELFDRALDLQARYSYAFYDSLIIAAAIEAGCDRLLTEDLQHGQSIEGVRIENPFLA